MTESDVAAMRSKVNQIIAENNRLRNEISMMENSVYSANSSVGSMSDLAIGTMRDGENTVKTDDQILHGVDKAEVEIGEMMKLYKNMESAYKEVRRLKNELRYNQGEEKKVRRLICATIDNELTNLASDETIEKQSEKVYTQASYFFLSYVLMDLHKRKKGEIAAADRAREKALEMDERKSVWVYYMVALRRGDVRERDFWLDRLVKTPLVGSEEPLLKLLVMIALTEKDESAQKLRKYVGIDSVSSVDKDAVVKSIRASFSAAMTVKPPEFKFLKKHVAESENLHEALRGAMNNEEIAVYMQQLAQVKEAEARNDFYAQMLDVVVESCCSPKSAEINKEIAYQEKIIEAKGVMEDAMALKVKEDVKLVSQINVEECLFKWLNESDRYAGKAEVTKFSYSKFKASYKRAYADYVNAYKNKYSETVTVTIGEFRNKTPLKNIDSDEQAVIKFCEDRCARKKAAIKDTKFILLAVFGALLLVAGIVLFILGKTNVIPNPWHIVALVVGVLAGVVLLLMGIKTKYGNYKAKIMADEEKARDIVEYCEVLRCVFAEMQGYREMFKSFDAKVLDAKFFDMED